ncbi:DHA2 family efflux MFS transporter permease subunit [Demequina mangrovi]|uniref:Drug resistance transporter, EmrB/QacA subfamily n=1 Tax=Demequina mangrovi TaxID=1043493 RepID=A0A1H6VWM6_9MICO|nr:DHA2 family efflux MFS transporter permease subunit [Demequina mangrovi]SEJ09071.1 drug resistance transporter, EmrB/QacA subfamily [Demequina mangrovi]
MTTTTRRSPLALVILAASIPAFMASLDNLVVTNALPVLATDLDATLEQLQWFINGYSLAFASMILMAVALGDRFGRRRTFQGGIVLFTFASILCALAPTAEALIAARVLQGIGGAALMPLSLAILSTNVSAKMRPLAIGIWGGVAGLGVAVGPLIGGAVVEGLTWHAIFWLNVPVGVVAIVLIRAFLTESRGDAVRLDLVGLGLGMAAVFGLVFGIVRGNDAGWTSAQVLAGLIGGGVLLFAFLAWENRVRDPLLPLGLFRDRSFSVANAVGLMFSVGIFGAVFILIQFLQVVQGKSPLEAGAMTMPWTMAPLFVAPLTGIIAPRVGTRVLVTAGVASQAAGLAWIGVALDPAVDYWTLVPGFVLCGVGMGLVFAPLATAVLAHMRDEDHAKASGTNATVREIGVALGIAVLTAVFTGVGGELTPTGYTDAAQTAVLWGAGILAVTTAVAMLLPSRRAELGGAPAAVNADPALVPA